MSDKVSDGGPAFPYVGMDYPFDGAQPEMMTVRGMSLRDYFAAHSDQPGQSQIATLLSWRCRGVNGVPYNDPDALSFDERWGQLTLSEQADAYSRVRYVIADAMLRAREAKS